MAMPGAAAALAVGEIVADIGVRTKGEPTPQGWQTLERTVNGHDASANSGGNLFTGNKKVYICIRRAGAYAVRLFLMFLSLSLFDVSSLLQARLFLVFLSLSFLMCFLYCTHRVGSTGCGLWLRESCHVVSAASRHNKRTQLVLFPSCLVFAFSPHVSPLSTRPLPFLSDPVLG